MYCMHDSNRSEGLVRRDGASVLSRDDDSLPVLVPHLVVQDLLDGLEAVVGEEDLNNQRKRSQKSVLYYSVGLARYQQEQTQHTFWENFPVRAA